MPLASFLPLVLGPGQALLPKSRLLTGPNASQHPAWFSTRCQLLEAAKGAPYPLKAACDICQSHLQEKNLPGSRHAVDSSSPTAGQPSCTRQFCPLLESIKQKGCFSFPEFLLQLGIRLQAWLGLGAAELMVLRHIWSIPKVALEEAWVSLLCLGVCLSPRIATRERRLRHRGRGRVWH